MGLRPTLHVGNDVEVLGNPHLVGFSLLIKSFVGEDPGAGHNSLRGADPAHQCLVPDAHAHNIQSAQFAILAPMERCLPVEKARTVANTRGEHVAEIGTTDRSGNALRTVSCLECGLVWTDPRPDADSTRTFYAEEYRLQYKSIFAPKPKHVYREIRRAIARFDLIAPLLCHDTRLLDVGSGGGFLLYVAQQQGITARGIEPNRGFAEYASTSKTRSAPWRGWLDGLFLTDTSLLKFPTSKQPITHRATAFTLVTCITSIRSIWKDSG